MIRIILPVFVLMTLIYPSKSIFAQNAEQDIENGVKIYNALQEYIAPFAEASKVTSEVINSVKKRVKDGSSLLDKAIENGTAEQIKTARYFKMNFKYKQAYVYGIKADNAACFKEMTAIKDEFESYGDASKFPLRYKFEGKNFVIKYEDFTPSLSQFYTVMSELGGSMSKPAMQYEYAKKTYNFPKIEPWYKYIATTQIVDYLTDKKQFDNEMAQYALEQIKIYTNELTAKERESVANINYPTPLSSGKSIKSVLEKTPNFTDNARICGEAALILMKNDERDDQTVLGFFKVAVKDDKYVSDALAFAQSRLNDENIILLEGVDKNNFKADNKELGISVLDKLSVKITDTQCDDLKKYADGYSAFGEAAKAKSLTERYNKCMNTKKKEEERRVAQQKADEAKREKERRRAVRETHFYAGVNVFPLFSKPIDLGGVLNFGAKNMLVEVSYLNVTKKKENYFDLEARDIKNVPEHKWDGYFAHLALKFATKKSSSKNSKMYSGPLVGYNVRTFEPFQANVTNTTTSQVSTQNFAPTAKQYILMYNMGAIFLSGLGGDMYFGIGAAYNQFDGGNGTYWNKDNYKIDDSFLTNRKSNYYSFTMRIGISVGFGR